MKILIVCSGNSPKGEFNLRLNQPFVYEQVVSLKKEFDITFDFFLIKGRGIIGYLLNFPRLLNKIKRFNPDLIHAHFGISGLLSSFQRIVPVITTFHGSDINNYKTRYLSKLVSLISKDCIFVNNNLPLKISYNGKAKIIPCGVNTNIFFPMERNKARIIMNLDLTKKYILFSSYFDNTVKNYELAKKSIEYLGINAELIELAGYSRKEVNLLLNSVDTILLTSYSEGSPQIVKEAMACNCPIVTVDVGDVKEILTNIPNCYVCSHDFKEIAESVKLAFKNPRSPEARKKVMNYKLEKISKKIGKIYELDN